MARYGGIGVRRAPGVDVQRQRRAGAGRGRSCARQQRRGRLGVIRRWMTRDLTERQGVRWGRPALGSLQLRARTEGFGGWNRMHCGDCL
jgi:hypothetical protein